jgi:adenylate cyclase
MSLSVEDIRNCLEGAVPSVIATCALDGTPNVAYLSQVHFVDAGHVALTFQFFNKTRENVLTNPRATVQVIDPKTALHYQLALQFLRTETAGPLFEHMKAKLASIASHTGMSKVFRLQGADLYRVLAITPLPGEPLPGPAPRRGAVSALRACIQRLSGCTDLAGLLDETLIGLEQHFDIRHAMVLMLNETGDRLYTVASRGYAESGVGSEIALGEGIVGVAARERIPIRIGYMAHESLYSRAVRERFADGQPDVNLEMEIPLPGLRESHSQLAVPILYGRRLLGMLYAESPEDMRFTYEDEDALLSLAGHLGMALHLIEHGADPRDVEGAPVTAGINVSGETVTIRHYGADDSVFLNDDYLIKGVAGAIIWTLLRQSVQNRRIEFTNRELRLDPTIRLPQVSENLEARLILLQRRLAERCDYLRIEKTGRGRFRLHVDRPVTLVEMPVGAAR